MENRPPARRAESGEIDLPPPLVELAVRAFFMSLDDETQPSELVQAFEQGQREYWIERGLPARSHGDWTDHSTRHSTNTQWSDPAPPASYLTRDL